MNRMRRNVPRDFSGRPGYGQDGWPADDGPEMAICRVCGDQIDPDTEDDLCEPCEAKQRRAANGFGAHLFATGAELSRTKQ